MYMYNNVRKLLIVSWIQLMNVYYNTTPFYEATCELQHLKI